MGVPTTFLGKLKLIVQPTVWMRSRTRKNKEDSESVPKNTMAPKDQSTSRQRSKSCKGSPIVSIFPTKALPTQNNKQSLQVAAQSYIMAQPLAQGASPLSYILSLSKNLDLTN